MIFLFFVGLIALARSSSMKESAFSASCRLSAFEDCCIPHRRLCLLSFGL